MGTTQDKLQAVLNSKNAIKEKFGLPDDMPFSQYADNIKGGGGGEKIYKCNTVAGVLPLRLTATVNGTQFAFHCGGSYFNAAGFEHWYYRTNTNKEWTKANTINDLGKEGKYITLDQNDYIEIWCDSDTAVAGVKCYTQDGSQSSNYPLLASGDLMSVFNYSDTVPDNALREFFNLCCLKSLPDLNRIKHVGYAGLNACFNGYQHIYTTDIVLDIDTAKEYAFGSMFSGNFRWTTPADIPKLKAVVRIKDFQGSNVCSYMFSSNVYLSDITLYCDSWTPQGFNNTFNSWVDEVASNGTFHKFASLPTENSASRVPSGWTVDDTLTDAAGDLKPPVDTSTNSWSGFEMVKSANGYYPASKLTVNLPWTEMTPQIGEYYNGDALLSIKDIFLDPAGNPNPPYDPEVPTADAKSVLRVYNSYMYFNLGFVGGTGFDRLWELKSYFFDTPFLFWQILYNQDLKRWELLIVDTGRVYQYAEGPDPYNTEWHLTNPDDELLGVVPDYYQYDRSVTVDNKQVKAAEGEEVNHQLTVNADYPVYFQLLEGSETYGLSVSPSGLISGTFNLSKGESGFTVLIRRQSDNVQVSSAFIGLKVSVKGNIIVAGFPKPFYVPMGQINNPNGLWTLGRWSDSTGFVADPTATGTDRAWLSSDGAALLYYSGGWYIDSIGAVYMGMGVYPDPQLDNPYNDDGSTCTWYSMGELVNGGSITPA